MTQKEIPYPNFLDFEQEFNLVGTEGGVPFDGGKKPIAFIQYLLKIAKGNNKNLVVLDFFFRVRGLQGMHFWMEAIQVR